MRIVLLQINYTVGFNVQPKQPQTCRSITRFSHLRTVYFFATHCLHTHVNVGLKTVVYIHFPDPHFFRN
jgi:hypothetical protein